KGCKKSRLNINQKTRNETISRLNTPQSGGICISLRLRSGAALGILTRAGNRCSGDDGRRLSDLLVASGLSQALLLGKDGDLSIFTTGVGLHRAVTFESCTFVDH